MAALYRCHVVSVQRVGYRTFCLRCLSARLIRLANNRSSAMISFSERSTARMPASSPSATAALRSAGVSSGPLFRYYSWPLVSSPGSPPSRNRLHSRRRTQNSSSPVRCLGVFRFRIVVKGQVAIRARFGVCWNFAEFCLTFVVSLHHEFGYGDCMLIKLMVFGFIGWFVQV
jgi:hypothetical protein